MPSPSQKRTHRYHNLDFFFVLTSPLVHSTHRLTLTRQHWTARAKINAPPAHKRGHSASGRSVVRAYRASNSILLARVAYIDPPPSAPTNPEAQRLNALIAPSPESPSQNAPWRSLLAPQNSSYATAFAAFRDAFASLTLLTWEERIDPSLRLQKARAEFFGLEPFIWIKPPLGASFGVVPPSAALLGPQSEANALAMGIKRPDGGFEVPWLARGLPGSKVMACWSGWMDCPDVPLLDRLRHVHVVPDRSPRCTSIAPQ